MKIALFQWALLGLWLWFSAVSFCQASSEVPGIKNEDTFIPPSKKPCLKKFHDFFHHPIPKFKKSHPPLIPDHKPEPKSKPEPESKPKPKSPEPKSEPKPKKESKPKPKPKVEPKPIYKPHPFFKKPFFKFPHPKKPFPPSKS
ncbi:hypothetical protein CsatB_018790 [Cannabis sativa]